MLNFLTQNIKNKVINEYSLRLVVVLLIMILIVVTFLIILFLPSLFISTYKSIAINDQYKTTMSNIKKDSLNSIEIVKEKNNLISALSHNNSKDISTSTSELIEKIFLLKNENIKISSISISNTLEEVKLIIGGISKTREGLTLFNKALKNSQYFDKIILPVVNLLKGTDIEFNITLIYKQK